MRLTSTIFLALLFSGSLSAQTNSTSPGVPVQPSGNGPTALVPPLRLHACPVLFSVDRIPNGAVIQANLTGPPALPRQGLTLTFRAPAAQIVAADISVHFYPSVAHAIPAAPTANDREPAPQTFHLSSASGPIHQSSIWTEIIAPVSWVELTRVEYSDGHTWTSSSPHQCGMAPSLFVLVSSAP